jgi:REP element-mobilizing transposase RayT
MVRPLRVHYEGATYHVFSKGNNDEYIFCEEDKESFLVWLAKGAEIFKVDVYAYCIMGNHYHLLIRTREDNLSLFMHYLGSAYATYMAKKGWKGHVFAGRYKSICVDEEEYLLVLSRYIHLNPVRAAIVERPEEYRWSSYTSYIGETKAPHWLKVERLLEYFGSGADPKSRYREFVESDIEFLSSYPDDNVVGKAVLGSRAFLEKLRTIFLDRGMSTAFLESRIFHEDLVLEEIYHKVCDHYCLVNLKIGEQSDKKTCRIARKIFIYLARSCGYFSNQEIADILGDIGSSCVSRHFMLMQDELECNSEFREEIENEIREIFRI